MASRAPGLQCLHFLRGATQSTPACRAFSTAAVRQTQSPPVQKRRRHDPYAVEQAKARRAANISRQQLLAKERAERLGDPVRGIETPFLKSFDDPVGAERPLQQDESDTTASPISGSWNGENFFANTHELETALARSRSLNTASHDQINRLTTNMLTGQDSAEAREKRLKKAEETAVEALRRITSLSLGSSKDRKKVNVRRCIEEFGRHNTDAILPPRPGSHPVTPEEQELQVPRAGKDTGSSEVQIAILTAKIREAATTIAERGNNDKHNKRNLRLLVHRRQRLLRYLRRKERAGPRWQNLVEKLGLTDGTWKGEINLPR